VREETSRILRLPFSADDIDQLPREIKKGPLAGTKIMLDYVGHAAATARLLDADMEWNWEPVALDDDGLPRIVRRGLTLELWIRLTVDGTARLGVGTVAVDDSGEDQDTSKELIGDAIRNAAMRFGVALDLWRKHAAAPVVASGPPCPHCGTPVQFNPEKSRGKKPAWSCPNFGCGGGSEKKDGTRWPWGSYDTNFFKQDEDTGLDRTLKITGPSGPAPSVPSDAFDDLTVNLQVLGIDEDQARAELETYRDGAGFAAGHVKDIRHRTNRACLLLVALGLEPEGVQAELWSEWQQAAPGREHLAWSTVRGSEVQSFAAHVQAFLKVRG